MQVTRVRCLPLDRPPGDPSRALGHGIAEGGILRPAIMCGSLGEAAKPDMMGSEATLLWKKET